MKWTTLQQNLGLTDHVFGRRVQAKIKDYNKMEEALAQYKKDLKKAGDDEAADINEKIQALQTSFDNLNASLCADMKRTKSTEGNMENITKNLKKSGKTKEQSTGNKEQVEETVIEASTTTVAPDGTLKTAEQVAAPVVEETKPAAATQQQTSTPKPQTTQQKPPTTPAKKNNNIATAIGLFVLGLIGGAALATTLKK